MDLGIVYSTTPHGKLVSKFFTFGELVRNPGLLEHGISINTEKLGLGRWNKIIPDKYGIQEVFIKGKNIILLPSDLGNYPIRCALKKEIEKYEKKNDVKVYGGGSIILSLPSSSPVSLLELLEEYLEQLERRMLIEYLEIDEKHLKIDIVPKPIVEYIDVVYLIKIVLELANIENLTVIKTPIHWSIWRIKEEFHNLLFNPDNEYEISEFGVKILLSLISNYQSLIEVIPTLPRKIKLFSFNETAFINFPIYIREAERRSRYGWGKRIAHYEIYSGNLYHLMLRVIKIVENVPIEGYEKSATKENIKKLIEMGNKLISRSNFKLSKLLKDVIVTCR